MVYCGQTVGWIKMKLGMRVGLGPGHIVLDEDPAPLPKGRHLDLRRHLAATIWATDWGAVPLWKRGAGFPSNTMWPGPRPTRMPIFILIRPTVWPQCANVTDRTGQTDRTERTDNGPIA